MDFLNKFSSSMRDKMKPVREKVEENIQLGKLNWEIRKIEDELEKQYALLGRECYAAIREQRDASDTFAAYAEKIDTMLSARKNLEEQKSVLRGARACPSCGALQEKGAKFCSSCGAYMPTEEIKQEEPKQEEPKQEEVCDDTAEQSDDGWAELKDIRAEIEKSIHLDSSEESGENTEKQE